MKPRALLDRAQTLFMRVYAHGDLTLEINGGERPRGTFPVLGVRCRCRDSSPDYACQERDLTVQMSENYKMMNGRLRSGVTTQEEFILFKRSYC